MLQPLQGPVYPTACGARELRQLLLCDPHRGSVPPCRRCRRVDEVENPFGQPDRQVQELHLGHQTRRAPDLVGEDPGHFQQGIRVPPQNGQQFSQRNGEDCGRRERSGGDKLRAVVKDRLNPQQTAGRKLPHADAPVFRGQRQANLTAENVVDEGRRIAFAEDRLLRPIRATLHARQQFGQFRFRKLRERRDLRDRWNRRRRLVHGAFVRPGE